MMALSVRADDRSQPDVPFITAPEVKQMLDAHIPFLLINALSPIEFELQHIPGSINIPASEVATTDRLSPEDERPKVFYCMGLKCDYSRHAVEAALRRGLKNIYWFRGGIPEWRQFGYPLWVNPAYRGIKVIKLGCRQIADRLQRDKSVFVLDVRPEWLRTKQWFLPDTVQIPMHVLNKHLEVLPRERPILLSDAAMRQSPAAARWLIRKGYRVIGVVRGGIQWADQRGCPAVKKPARLLIGEAPKP